MERRGRDLAKLKFVVDLLSRNETLPFQYWDYPFIGNYKNRRGCHIESNWLLIYKVEGDLLILERTGSHSDLFN